MGEETAVHKALIREVFSSFVSIRILDLTARPQTGHEVRGLSTQNRFHIVVHMVLVLSQCTLFELVRRELLFI